MHTKCARCDHFIEENASPPYFENGRNIIAPYVHLDDGEKEHDHDALPGQSMPLAVWRSSRPSLFKTYADGKIGPNSEHYAA